MATNLKIAFPDIPFNAVSITSSETYATDKPVINLVTGSRSKIAELATSMLGQHRIEFDLGSGVSQACDYLALGNAKLLKKSGVDYVRLRGSEVSYEYPTSMLSILDMEEGITAGTTKLVSQITDQSGNGNHATQSSDSLKPIISRSDNKENRIQYSQAAFANVTYWSTAGHTFTEGQSDPFGGTKATKFTTSGGASRHFSKPVTGVSPTFTINDIARMSVYLKTGITSYYAWVGFDDGTYKGAIIDPSTGIILASSGVTASTETIGNGWFRITLLYTVIATGTVRLELGHTDTTTVSSGPRNFNADGNAIIYYGAQTNISSASADYVNNESIAYPQYAGINGNRVITFDGGDYLFANGIATALSGADVAFTVFGVIQSSNTTGLQTWFGMGNTGDGGQAAHRVGTNGSSGYWVWRRGNSSSTIESTFGTNNTSLHVISAVFTGTTMSVYVDGTRILNALAMNTPDMTVNRATIGALFRTSAENYVTGKIGFFAISASAMSDANREAWEDYLTNRFSIAPIVTVDLQNVTLTGARDKDYITTFTESAAYRYWIAQYDADETSKRPLSKLYFGKLFDFGRDPQLGAQVESKYHQDKGIHEKRSFSLNYKGISTLKRQDFEDKIGNKKDVNHVMLHTTTYDTPLLTTDLTSGEIKSAKFESNGAQQNDLSIKIDETY